MIWIRILLLRYTNDLSYEEMCTFLEVPLSKIQNDLYRAKQRLKHIEKLPDSFTEQVMAALDQVVLEKVTVVTRDPKSSKMIKFRRFVMGAASVLIVLFAVIVYSVPTLAETLRSLFVKDNVDIGLLRAQEFDLVQHPNIKVKDKGYTIKIDEAVADPTRVIVALQLFGPDGKHDRERLVFADGNKIEVKDTQGKVVGELYDYGRRSHCSIGK